MSTHELDGVALWLLWKQASEVVRSSVIQDVVMSSPLSEAELTVLVHLGESGGRLRQSVLAASAGWDRSRLSHLLTRMEERGYLSRERIKNGVDVVLSSGGLQARTELQPLLDSAVARHVVDRLTPEQRQTLGHILLKLTSDETPKTVEKS